MLDPLRDSLKASGNYAPDAPEFVVYVPDGVAGCPVQVEAPDGVVLEIELPDTVVAGDVINFQKQGEAWIPHLTSSVPVTEPPYSDPYSAPYSAVSLSDGICNVGDIGGQIIEDSQEYQFSERDAQINMESSYEMRMTDYQVSTAADGSIHVVVEQLRTHVEEQTIAMSTRLEEHQVRYMEEQDAILGRLETVEQFLQQMAPALQGLLDRFETEQAERNTQAQQMNEKITGLQCELSKVSELTQAKTVNQDESILRLEAEMTRLQESVAATALQLQPLAGMADGKAADSQAVEQLLKLVEHERYVNGEKHTAIEARLESLTAANTEKLNAIESRVEMVNAYSEERESRLDNNVQAITATVQQQGTAFSQKLAEVNMAVAQRPAAEPSGGTSFDMDVIMKRFEEEQLRSLDSLQQLELAMNKRLEVETASNLHQVELTLNKRIEEASTQNTQALKWIEVALNSCKEEQTRLSEEQNALTALSTRLDVVESRSTSNVDRGNVERQRIEAVETRLQAMDRIERELRNSSVNSLAISQRVEAVEAEQAKLPETLRQSLKEVASSITPESLTKMEKMQHRLRDESVAMASRLKAVETSISTATSEAIKTTAMLSRMGKMETAIEKLIRASDAAAAKAASDACKANSTTSKANSTASKANSTASKANSTASKANSTATDPGSGRLHSASKAKSTDSKANSTASDPASDLLHCILEANSTPTVEASSTPTAAVAHEQALPKVQDALKDTHSRIMKATKLPDEVLKMHSDLLQKLARPAARNSAKVISSGLDTKVSPYELEPRMRSMTPPRSPLPPPRYVEPSVSIKVEGPPPSVLPPQMRQSSLSPTPSTSRGRRSLTPPRNAVVSGGASANGSYVPVAPISSPTNSLMNPGVSPTSSANMMATANFGYGVAHERGRATSPRSEPLFNGSMAMAPQSGSAQFSQQSGSHVSGIGGTNMTSEPLFVPGMSSVSGTQVPTQNLQNVRQASYGGSGWWG